MRGTSRTDAVMYGSVIKNDQPASVLRYLKLPSNFPRSERRGNPTIDVFDVDELIAKGLGFALQIRQHPIAILLFIRLLARVHVGRTIPQHAIDEPGQL